MKRPLIFALLCCLSSGAWPASPGPRTHFQALLYFTRHAEKLADDSRDPALSEAGLRRAAALAERLDGSGVTLIITTPFERTRSTAQLVADRIGASLIEAPVDGGVEQHVQAVVRLIADNPTQRILVVGHSNTLGPIIRGLDGPAIAPIAEDQYGDLYLLHVQDGLSRSHYGD